MPTQNSTTKEPRPRLILGVLLWLAGLVGVISLLPVLPQLLSDLTADADAIPIPLLLAATFVQTSVLVAVAVILGTVLAPKVGLKAPVFEAAASLRALFPALRPQLVPGIIGGLVGGLAIVLVSWLLTPSLPADFLEAAEGLSLPLLPRVLYGGITEEILIRWGLMTLFVWIPFRTLQKGSGDVKPSYFVAAITISAILFGAGHLPTAQLLSSSLTGPLITYIILANGLFGIVAGYLYWKRGLESAMIAHMLAHVVLLTAERLIG